MNEKRNWVFGKDGRNEKRRKMRKQYKMGKV